MESALLSLIGGLVLLILGGDALVRGAVALSLRLGVPAMLVSATVVAFGTSAPELLISIQAAIEGGDARDLVYGNVVGSNIANVFLVLGLPAIFASIAATGNAGHRNLYFMLIATVLFTALALGSHLLIDGEAAEREIPNTIVWWGGLILIGFSLIMILDAVRAVYAGEPPDPSAMEEVEADSHMQVGKIALLVVGGLIGLPLGAHFLIEGAQEIAEAYDVSEAVIGLTIVAVGTSLPELATAVMAAIRKQADVIMGSVIGSNIFNLTLIFGAAAVVTDMPVPEEVLYRDLWAMIVATLIVTAYVLTHRPICRWTGVGFVGLYGAYVIFALA